MFESEKALLKKLCQKNNFARQAALSDELNSRGVRFENWNMALVVPSVSEEVIVLCAHFDAAEGSYGYNDNGMALVTALNLINNKLPYNVEVVFTNCEEQGGLGAEYYLRHTSKEVIGCINLDVVGCFDQVYLDTMNFSKGRKLQNCKQGMMPFSDAHVFAHEGIPSICFSSGPADTDFRNGIMQICSTLHNNCNDNQFGLLNFEMIEKVCSEVKNAINLMAA